MRLLFIASDPMEFTGVVARSAPVKRASLAVDWARTGRVSGHEALLVANGVGPNRAAEALRAASGVFLPDAVVSIGFCGALEPSLAIGDVVVASSVTDGRSRYAVQPLAAAGAHRTGTVYSADHVVQTTREKAELRDSGACAVEMEAAGIACAGFPFYCVKAVTDLAGETMANDFNAALRPDGHFDTMVILRRTLRRPVERVPELLRLRNRCVRAARILGDFFADCRF